jgi:tRNA pseudouridine55 synthase
MTQSGIILIDKPEGPSSAEVVRRIKTLLRPRKIGHLGSLDPFASGLLLVGVNEGTKVADLFLSASKSYRGVIVLGIETDTQDATGQVIGTHEVPAVGGPELKAVEEKFTGNLHQIPPMFSALKKNGVPLYRLARQGKEVERAPRPIHIERLRLKKLHDHELEFNLTCSRGTYVRALAADIGRYLNCGAHLKNLRRTACGHLTLDGAITLDTVGGLAQVGKVPLESLAAALSHLRSIQWDLQRLSALRLGQQEVLAAIGDKFAGEKVVRLLDPWGALAALVEWSEEQTPARWRLWRVFHPEPV